MNPIKHLKNVGKGKRVFLVGNGPSLNDMDLDLLVGEDTIAMNRIDMIYPKTRWRPTYYIFCSDNCRNRSWGNEWSKSIVNAASQKETTPIIWNRYKGEIEKRGGKLDKSTIYLKDLSENAIGSTKAFSTNAEQRLDKSGTTMNVALQMAYYMGYEKVYIIGCDSNWVTATKTKKQGDPNHFHKNYHASIGNGQREFNRMNNTHKVARKAYDKAGKSIFNAGLNSAINAYEKVIFEDLVVKRPNNFCCDNLLNYWFEGVCKVTEHGILHSALDEVECKSCGISHDIQFNGQPLKDDEKTYEKTTLATDSSN